MARARLVTADMLVTGVTGFVGREVAHHLLASGRSLVALARAREGVPAAARVAAALGIPPGDRRVSVVDGDLAAPDCGVDLAGWQRMRASVETVIHCAGDTAFAPHRLEPFEAAHVTGPRHLLERLALGRLRRWIHVSTAYVCGRRTGVILESEGDVGQAFHNVYERVKLAAEAELRAAGERAGVEVRVGRPGVVVGAAPATAGGTPANLFFDFIRMAAALAARSDGRAVRLRIEAAPEAAFNIVPVDYVAAALVHLAQVDTGADGTFHLVARDTPSQATALSTIGRRLGIEGLALVERLEDPTPLERRVARMLLPYRPYLARPLVFADDSARRVFPGEILARATLSRARLHALIDLALTTEPAGVPIALPS